MEEVVPAAAMSARCSFVWAMQLPDSQNGKGDYMSRALQLINNGSDNPRLRLVKEGRIPSAIDLTMDVNAMPIRELLECCLRTNGEAAWGEFVERIRPTIQGVIYKRVCRRGLPDPRLIQDLANSTFVKLLQALPNFKWQGDGQFFGWVKHVALSAVEDWYRKPRREETGEEVLNTAADSRFSEEKILLKLRCDEIEQSLNAIDATEQDIDIFWFYFRHGYTSREISEMPGIQLTEKQAETILARMVRQLRRKMGGTSSSE